MRMRKVRHSKTNPGLPADSAEAISLAKELFRLKLLTMNTMWPSVLARVHAVDQLNAVHSTLGMGVGKFFFVFQVHALIDCGVKLNEDWIRKVCRLNLLNTLVYLTTCRS